MERLREFWRLLLGHRRTRPRPRAASRRFRPDAMGPALALEARQLLTTATPAAVILSVAPTDGQGVRVSYRVDRPGPVRLAVYRSADDKLDSSDRLVGTSALPETPGLNESTVVLEGGLPPEPARPYVLAAIESDGDSEPTVASYRTHSMVVLVHGGMQISRWKNGPPWMLVMGKTLEDQGYELAVPFSWVYKSRTPGAAAPQGRRLAAKIVEEASSFPPGEPVDVHLIGHSEGAVVLTQGLRLLGPSPTPEIGEGYLRVTLLDPYSASNGVPGQNLSVSGPLGWLAESLFSAYQSQADDPPVIVPAWVDGAEVFYQQTPAWRDHGTNNSIYNPWGQVPVRGVSVYYDLTPASVTHSGKTGVPAWYQRHIVPILGGGAQELADVTLTAHFDGTAISGKAEAGVTVRLLAATADNPDALSLAGRAEAGPEGDWSIPVDLRPGRYRVVARSAPDQAPAGERITAVSTAPVGLVVVPAAGRIQSGRNSGRL